MESGFPLNRDVRFKGDNGLYLGHVEGSGALPLRFAFEDPNDKSVKHKITKMLGGVDGYKIKNDSLGEVWRVHPDTGFIWANERGPTTDPPNNDLFQIVELGGNTVAIQSLWNSQYCRRTTKQIADGLNCNASDTTDPASHFVVEEVKEEKKN